MSTFLLLAPIVIPISPEMKTIKAYVCPCNKPIGLSKEFKMTSTALPVIVGNVSTALPAILLRKTASCFSRFFRAPSSGWDGTETVGSPYPPKTPVIASTTAEMVIERALSIDTTVMPSSQNKVRIRSANYLSSPRTFSMDCLIVRYSKNLLKNRN